MIDDLDGRRAALARGLAIRGTVGVLVSARVNGIIAELRPALTALIAEGFRLDRRLYQEALASVGEQAGGEPA